MVRSAVILLAKHGVQGTSFRDVVAHAQAPRGSIYHHFPDGKDQLLAAAVDVAGGNAIGVLDTLEGLPPAEIVTGFIAMWRAVLERSEYSAGCSVLAVTVSSETPELIDRAGGIFRAWTARLAELFSSGGMAEADASAAATLLIAASEGAVVLARAQRDMAPLETVLSAMQRAVAA
jgi:AcrR family transcriptional regulator